MRIMMLLFKDIRYDARVQREAVALAEAGYMVDIACLDEYGDKFSQELNANIRIIRISIQIKRLKRDLEKNKKGSFLRKMDIIRKAFLKFTRDVYANKEFYRNVKLIMRRHVYTAIHCHDLNTLPVGYYLAKKFKTELIYDSHELFNEMANKNFLERKIGYVVERHFIRKIYYLIVVNQLIEEEFIKRYGPMQTLIVQNIPDLRLNKDPLKKPLRETYCLTDEDILVLYQGGLSPERGLEECFKALSLLPDNFKFIIIGQGSLKPHLKQLSIDLGIEKRVYFYGQVPPEQLMYYTKQADLGLVMYKNTCKNNYYSTPNKIFEYLLSGVPTVASNHPGKKYVVEDGEIGICVEEHPDSIANGIREIINNISYYKNNCLTNKDRFMWEKEAEKLVSMYNRMEKYYEESYDHYTTLSARNGRSKQ